MGTKQFDSATDLITFTRASGGTALRKVSYGSELVTNGNFATDTNWTKETGWTISGGKASFVSSGSGNRNLRQAISLTVGKVYYFSYDVLSISAGEVSLRLGGMAGVNEISATTTGSFSGTIVPTGSANGEILIEDNSNSFVGSIDNISVKEVTFDQPDGTLQLFNSPANVPRIEYNPDGTIKGLLIEEARTNLVTNSTLSGSWSGGGWVRTLNATEAPDGTNTAVKIVWDATTAYHTIFNTYNVNAQQAYTRSVYVKASGISWIYLQHYDAGGGASDNGGVYFDVANGVKGVEASGTTGLIENVGNGWYRCSVAYTTSANTTTERLQISFTTGDNVSPNNLTGDNVSGVFLYGAQLEAGAFPTSYIPTTGSTATRAADVATIPVSAFGYNSDAGSILVEAQRFGTNNYPRSVMIDAGSESDSISLGAWGSTTSLTALIKVGSVKQADMFLGPVGTSAFKNSIAYKENDFAASRDGNTVLTDTSGTVPTGMTTLTIGRNGVTTQFFNGHIKSIQYYPRRLSNAQLQELTT